MVVLYRVVLALDETLVCVYLNILVLTFDVLFENHKLCYEEISSIKIIIIKLLSTMLCLLRCTRSVALLPSQAFQQCILYH